MKTHYRSVAFSIILLLQVTATCEAQNSVLPMWFAESPSSNLRFSVPELEDWLCPGSPPPPDEPKVHKNEIDCTIMNTNHYTTQGDPWSQFEAASGDRLVLFEVNWVSNDVADFRPLRICQHCQSEIDLSCGRFQIKSRLDPWVEQPWSSLQLFPQGTGGAYQGDLEVHVEVQATHVDQGWTAARPRVIFYSGHGTYLHSLEGLPPSWPTAIDADCDGIEETSVPIGGSPFRPASGRDGAASVECFVDYAGSGQLCLTSAPVMP